MALDRKRRPRLAVGWGRRVDDHGERVVDSASGIRLSDRTAGRVNFSVQAILSRVTCKRRRPGLTAQRAFAKIPWIATDMLNE